MRIPVSNCRRKKQIFCGVDVGLFNIGLLKHARGVIFVCKYIHVCDCESARDENIVMIFKFSLSLFSAATN